VGFGLLWANVGKIKASFTVFPEKTPAISGGFFRDWQKIDKGQGLIQPLKWTVFYKKHDIPAYCIYVS